jgi:hypothetical protein
MAVSFSNFYTILETFFVSEDLKIEILTFVWAGLPIMLYRAPMVDCDN